MRSQAELCIDGASRLARVVSAPPITFRAAGDAVYIVGTAAGPLGEDHVTMRVDVAAGGTLRLRSAAATIVYAGKASRQTQEVRVGPGASLDWHPEPLIATGGCHHVQDVTIDLAEGAHLDWTEEIVLGRHGEEPGVVEFLLRVDVAGRPLVRHQLAIGRPGWDGPAVLGPARATGLRLVVGPDRGTVGCSVGVGWAWMELEGPGRLLAAVAGDLAELRRRMTEA